MRPGDWQGVGIEKEAGAWEGARDIREECGDMLSSAGSLSLNCSLGLFRSWGPKLRVHSPSPV